jgi:hypothetical protein
MNEKAIKNEEIMSTINKIFGLVLLLFILAIPLLLAFKGGKTTTLDAGEETHLIYMRQEEKLARDVYLTLGTKYPELAVFANIAVSEQQHTDAMLDKLEQFEVPDPVTDDTVGVFTGVEFGPYFTATYLKLVAMGNTSSLNALYVGALIEELDMHDIVECPVIIVETDNGIGEGECGMEYTEVRALVQSFGNLLDGSKNHLRAFVGNIESVIGEGNYVAQYLTQEEVDEILGR